MSLHSVESSMKGIKADMSVADSLSGQPVLIPELADNEAWSGSLGFKVTLWVPLWCRCSTRRGRLISGIPDICLG